MFEGRVGVRQGSDGRWASVQGHAPQERTLPEPRKPYLANLGGGIAALVPLALYVDEERTRPRVPKEVRPPEPAKPLRFQPSGKDRATRLAAVAAAWNVGQHFYPYFDDVETDWPGALRRALKDAATDTDENAFLHTLLRLTAALQDGRPAPGR